MKNKHKNFYIVTAKCGHVGVGKYILIDFAINANSPEHAEKITLSFPRVKRNPETAILRLKEVTFEQYITQFKANQTDPYLSNKGYKDPSDKRIRTSLYSKREESTSIFQQGKRRLSHKQTRIGLRIKKEQLYLSETSVENNM